jgi:DNA repair exonuclease SbcCD ATPase subunit
MESRKLKMKLKKIKINGIRGFNYLKDENGNPLPHLIELNEKHLFLYGENGTGKSSLFDAIEWCFTGEIEESHNRKIQNPKDFLANKFCDAKDNPYVEILFTKKNTEETFLRKLIKNKNPNFKYENEAKEHFIESNRIDNFVIDTKASLWQRFSDLLGSTQKALDIFEKIGFENEARKAKDQIKKMGM